MSNIVLEDSGKIRNLDDIELVEDIIKLKNNKKHWEVVAKLVDLWARKAPEEEKAVQINIDQYKEQLKDKKFGTTVGGADHERRFKLSFPYTLMMMIRSIYKSEELVMDEEFFEEFAQRFPAFKVAEQ